MCDKKCKNIECLNIVKDNRTYCSLTCRNIYVNKYLRDYTKNSKSLSRKSDYLNDVFCKECKKNLPYEKRRNSFCSSNCSAIFSNKNRVGIKYDLSDSGRESLVLSALKTNGINKEQRDNIVEDYYKNPKKCEYCNSIIKYENRNKKKKFCSVDCKNDFARRNMSEFQKYKRECMFRFNLSDYPEEFNFNLIKEFGWYKPTNRGNNLDGVSRDHIYSVRDGFDNDVDPSLISHPANCKLILQRQNSSKYKRSDITIVELKEKIKNWKLKYNE